MYGNIKLQRVEEVAYDSYGVDIIYGEEKGMQAHLYGNNGEINIYFFRASILVYDKKYTKCIEDGLYKIEDSEYVEYIKHKMGVASEIYDYNNYILIAGSYIIEIVGDCPEITLL